MLYKRTFEAHNLVLANSPYHVSHLGSDAMEETATGIKPHVPCIDENLVGAMFASHWVLFRSGWAMSRGGGIGRNFEAITRMKEILQQKTVVKHQRGSSRVHGERTEKEFLHMFAASGLAELNMKGEAQRLKYL